MDVIKKLQVLKDIECEWSDTLQTGEVKIHDKLPWVRRTAQRIGIDLDDIDKLSIIHITGTKGKGSTCAYIESILRHHNYKTGFFSSPHLVEIRERIRINGRPLGRDAFVEHFWTCYNKLEETKAQYQDEMSGFFMFMTIVAFHVFIQEQVDVAIIEVGIGGEYDCTNIIRSPVVCGITCLDLDHLGTLGNTLEDIAWHKAGILKPGVPAVISPQPDKATNVIMERAAEKGSPVFMAPSFESYDWGSKPVVLGIAGEVQKVNASVAMQLSQMWMENHKLEKKERLKLYSNILNDKEKQPKLAETFVVSQMYSNGLTKCRWAGRNQTYKRLGLTYYIDGAHTVASVKQCADWFKQSSTQEAQTICGKTARILMFNVSKDRDPTILLQHLTGCDFDCAIFCTNIPISADQPKSELSILNTVSLEVNLERRNKCKNAWLKLLSQKHGTSEIVTNGFTENTTQLESNGSNIINSEAKTDQQTKGESNGLDDNSCFITQNNKEEKKPVYEFVTILDALHWLCQGHQQDGIVGPPATNISTPLPTVLKEAKHLQLLCTGSLYLVGGLISLIDPDINDNINNYG